MTSPEGRSSPLPPVEREVKIPLDDIADLRRRLAAAGATPRGPTAFEDDCLFDDAGRDLSARGHVLRLRVQRPTDGSPIRAILTWKGPPTVESGARVREEIETAVADPEALRLVLGRLGYVQSFRYQKRRTPFDLAGAFIALDETPLGAFVEIEGEHDAIRAASRQLGIESSRYLTSSYAQLWREAHAEGDMLMRDDDGLDKP